MLGRYPHPFHLPPGLLQVLLPGQETRSGHSPKGKAPFSRGKSGWEIGPGTAVTSSPFSERLNPLANNKAHPPVGLDVGLGVCSG